MSLETPTWDKIIGPLGSTTSEFGGSWGNLISDYFNGVNIALIDASKIPIIGTLTRYKFEKFGLFDSDQSHYISFSIDDIDTGVNRKIKFRRMNTPFEEDYAVLEGLPQAIINKTIDSDLNTITNIENADIKSTAAISDTKLAQITNKAKLPSSIVYTDQTNTFGAFNQIFPTSILLIGDSDASHSYIIAGSNLIANRTLTLPLLTGNDTVAVLSLAQTLTNKTLTAPIISTISNTGTLTLPTSTDTLVGRATTDTLTNKTFNADGTGNSITNIEDADIKAAAGIVTTKLADSTNFVLTTRTNSFGDFNQVFKDNRLLINNPADTFAYTIIGAAIGGNRNITLPLLNGNDVMVTEAFAQTLSNKSIDADTNTITNIENTDIKAAAGIVTTKLADSANFILKTLDNSFGAHYQDFTKMTVPGNPGSNDIRLYVDTADTHLKIKNNAGTIVDLHSGGGGGATNLDALTDVDLSTVAPVNGDVLTYTSTGTKWIPSAPPGAGGSVTASSVTTFTNKTIDADGTGNSITNIENADIKAAAGIVTTKLADSTNFVLTTRTNSFGDFNQVFKDNRLLINNPADTFAYTIIAGAIAANRNITLPVLLGDDTLVTQAFAQALTNKTIDADSNTITNIEDADIKTAAGIVTTKLADSANFILKTLDNSFGAHYFDITRMTAPANPAANDGRVYAKQIDANNDGVFCKIKKAGSFVEVQIA